MSLYAYVSNNPLRLLDPFGLYEIEWEGDFTDAEKKAILDSIQRVRDRCKELISQIDDNIKELENLCPCGCYDDLIKKLKGLKAIFEGMIKEIDDPGWNLEIYKRDLDKEQGEYWDAGNIFYCDDELALDPDWFKQSQVAQDQTMMHEITHGQKTVDRGPNPWNDAHQIQLLMHVDKDNWGFYANARNKADQKCKHRKK